MATVLQMQAEEEGEGEEEEEEEEEEYPPQGQYLCRCTGRDNISEKYCNFFFKLELENGVQLMEKM